MFCPKCGTQNDSNNIHCIKCGNILQQIPGQSIPQKSVSTYLIPAILMTLCCCLPLGIVAIVYAAQVKGKLVGGDYAGALKSSKKARMWCWLSFVIGLLIIVIIIGSNLLFLMNIQNQMGNSQQTPQTETYTEIPPDNIVEPGPTASTTANQLPDTPPPAPSASTTAEP